MGVNIKLTNPDTKSKPTKQHKYEPTWEEVWYTGYEKKKGIAQLSNTDKDKERLREVKQAIEGGELLRGVDSLRKFSKTHALRLYETLKESRKDEYIKQLIQNMPDNYVLVDDHDKLDTLILKLKYADEIALDTETTGLGEEDRIVGLSISIDKSDYHCYIPVRHTKGRQFRAKYIFDILKPYLESDYTGKILHNAKFDVHMFYKEGIDIKGITMDTMIAMHVLNENEHSYALKNIATKYGAYFGFEDKSWTYEELFGKGGFQDTPLDIGTYYACKDTHLTLSLAKWIREQFDLQPLLKEAYTLENKVLEVVIRMERNGMLLDKEFADKYSKELKEEIDVLKQKATDMLGIENINSNKQLLEWLQKNVDKKIKSCDKATLKPLKDKYEAIDTLLKYRKLEKVYGTYIEPIPKVVHKDGRIHPRFNQRGTVTCRFSSNSPNFQNLPYEAREMFIAPGGKLLVGIDFSQQEVRYMAHLSGDKELQDPYIKGEDIYATLASKVFKKPIEECRDGSEYRKKMKVGVLAVMYGISPFQLAGSLGMTEKEAEKFLDDFIKGYPNMEQFMKDSEQFAVNNGYVPIEGGFKRRLPELPKLQKSIDTIKRNHGIDPEEIWESKLSYQRKRNLWDNVIKKYFGNLRQAVNARVQGGSAIMTKKALVNLQRYFDENGLDDYLIVATVHDEIIFELPETVTYKELETIALIMCNALPMSIPMKSDIQIMKKWGIDYKEGFQVTNK